MKFKIGERVEWEDLIVTVVKHGRDSSGIYTLIELPDGQRIKVHRHNLRRLELLAFTEGR